MKKHNWKYEANVLIEKLTLQNSFRFQNDTLHTTFVKNSPKIKFCVSLVFPVWIKLFEINITVFLATLI